jgi:hypothetical protein
VDTILPNEAAFHARFLLVRRLAALDEGIHAERN